MRQGDGSDLLGAGDARGASIGIIYVAPTDDRPSVLEAILMQDKLGRKQVAVVLPEKSRAFQRPVDFDGLKNMRRGLKTEIIFVAPGVPGPAEFARQRRFTVYTSLESYTTALRAESPDNSNGNAKKGLLLFARKPKLVPNASAPAPLEDFSNPGPPLPLAVPVVPVDASPPVAAVPSDENENNTWDDPAPIAPILAVGGAGIADASLDTADNWPQPTPTTEDNTNSHVPPVVPLAGDEDVKPISRRPRSEPIPIVVPLQTGAKTKPLAPGATGNTPSVKKGTTGKRAVVGAAAVGAVGAGAAAFAATGHAPVSGGAQPPIRGNAGGSGGGGGGGRGRSRRSTRQLLAILLVILTLLLLAGIAFASPMGKGLIGNITGSTVTATVTITPLHPKEADSFVVTAVTGTPDPGARQVKARILSYTSPSGSGSANATGSIQGANATGTLVFINIGNFGVTVSGGTLTGADGVQVSFGSFPLPIGSANVLGTVTSQGAAGNIRSLDINGTCCGSSNIIVKNPNAFSGGRDPITNAIITQNDITSASNKLVSSLTPGAQTALQQQVQSGEQVVSGSLKCTPNNLSPNQHVGDQAKSVTVTGKVKCTEEVYDQKGALSIGVDALKAEAAKNLGAHYVLVGNVLASVRPPTTIDGKGSISLVVDAQGQWVYHFTDADLAAIKNKLAKESQSAAQSDVNKTAGVESAVIKISSGTTMPDAANITITVVSFPPITGSPTPGSGSPTTTPGTPTTPTGSPAITPTPGLGNGQTVTPSPVLGGS